MAEYIPLSHIGYDRDEPSAMYQVWNVWIVDKDTLGEDYLDGIKDDWYAGKVKLSIPQMDWTKIVVRCL